MGRRSDGKSHCGCSCDRCRKRESRCGCSCDRCRKRDEREGSRRGRGRCRKGKRGECPDLARLCVPGEIFAQRIQVSGVDFFDGFPQYVALDCEGCLTTEQMRAIAATIGFEVAFILSTEPGPRGGYPIRDFFPFLDIELGRSGTADIAAARFIRDHLLCDPCATSVVLDYVNGVGLVTVDFDAAGNPGITIGPTDFGPIMTDAQVAQLLACMGLAPADLVPGLPVQRTTANVGGFVLPLRTQAALDAIPAAESDAFAACLGAFFAANFPDESPFIWAITTEATPEAQITARIIAPGFEETWVSVGPTVDIAAYVARYEVFGPPPVTVTIRQGIVPGFITITAFEQDGEIFARTFPDTFVAEDARFHVGCDVPAPTPNQGRRVSTMRVLGRSMRASP